MWAPGPLVEGLWSLWAQGHLCGRVGTETLQSLEEMHGVDGGGLVSPSVWK